MTVVAVNEIAALLDSDSSLDSNILRNLGPSESESVSAPSSDLSFDGYSPYFELRPSAEIVQVGESPDRYEHFAVVYSMYIHPSVKKVSV